MPPDTRPLTDAEKVALGFITPIKLIPLDAHVAEALPTNLTAVKDIACLNDTDSSTITCVNTTTGGVLSFRFLPYTVHFNVPGPPRRPSPPRRQSTLTRQASRDGSARVPSLFDTPRRLGTTGPTPPLTPTPGDVDDPFAQPPPPVAENSTSRLQELSTIARSDPHSPRWGSADVFFQPPSRAGPPPPPSILKHTKVVDKLGRWKEGAQETLQDRSPRDRSHDRLFADAEWSVVPAEQGNGGLRNAIEAATNDGSPHERTWVGTLGMPTDALSEERKKDIQNALENEHDAMTVWCKDSDFDGHYNHYSKQILWPVFHYQIPDNPKSKAYEDHSWVYYVKVNQAFADKVVRNYKRGDIIWIHDYHLLLVPSMIRQRLPNAKIGFFLHVAFPSSEVFRCLAVRKELLEGLLGCNLIGFQTEEYCRHFLQTCSRLLCVEATNEGVQLEDRFISVINLAIGIDPDSLRRAREDPAVAEWVRVMRERYQGKRLIVARDKLDHVRGVRQKLLAYELFLNKYPQWKDQTVLIQVATSTTEQAELDATVSDIVTRVNSSHASLAHQPLVFLKQDISFPQYLAMLTVADALMITSLREGMNLTSHEFVFCQDGQDGGPRHGCLILSEFTGSTSVFGGAELAVNPYDAKQCADAIRIALEMSADERARRWRLLHDVVTHRTAAYWVHTFIERLSQVYEEQQARETVAIPRLSINALAASFRESNRRLFFLDYEGTLASWGNPSSIILTSPQRVLDVLNDLLLDRRNGAYVMSARTPEELERLFRRVPGLGLIAENGCFLRPAGAEAWTALADPAQVTTWKQSVLRILEYYRERLVGSRVEERHCSLIFHYEDAEDQTAAARQAGDCANHINDACEAQRVRAIPVDHAVLVEPIDWSKATAARHVFERLTSAAADGTTPAPPDFLMVAGDDREDETIFRWANQLDADGVVPKVTTVSVGSRSTQAMATLTQGVTGMLSALQKLAALSGTA
ncbi:MAG: hypothetical protein M1838_003815 [Thelocarpon superellum]|nr:MAG: hypothetical protein M1838_003815 [Thelocarpon superellum]